MPVKVSNFPLGSRDALLLSRATVEDIDANEATAPLDEGVVILQPVGGNFLAKAGPNVTNGDGGFLLRDGVDTPFLVRAGDKIGVSAA